MKTDWHPSGQINKRLLPPAIRTLLFDTGSLTRQLEKFCSGRFNLELLGQNWQKPLFDESRALRLPANTGALVREINLRCDATPWVYGRSVIPARTLSGQEQRLYYWGHRSLGDYLFAPGRAQRDRIEVRPLTGSDALFHLAMQQARTGADNLWARRSLFYIKHKPLLVVEVFFPDLLVQINT